MFSIILLIHFSRNSSIPLSISEDDYIIGSLAISLPNPPWIETDYRFFHSKIYFSVRSHSRRADPGAVRGGGRSSDEPVCDGAVQAAAVPHHQARQDGAEGGAHARQGPGTQTETALSHLIMQGCQTAKFDPFLSLDCDGVESVGAQSKERKGSNFAAQRSGAIVQEPKRPNTYDL